VIFIVSWSSRSQLMCDANWYRDRELVRALGTLALGTLALGTLALGTLALGTLALGNKSEQETLHDNGDGLPEPCQ
jgi:hypothetical protein